MNITVIYKHPNQHPKLLVIENELEQMQTLVGGYIETVPIYCGADNSLVVVCDEEGKLKHREANIVLKRADWLDVVVGSIFAAKVTGDDFADLTRDEAVLLMNTLEECAVYG